MLEHIYSKGGKRYLQKYALQQPGESLYLPSYQYFIINDSITFIDGIA